MTKPKPGDEIAADDTGVWHRPPNAPWRELPDVQADLSNPERFTVRRRVSGPVYRAADHWQIEVVDDNESTPGMRRGEVVTFHEWLIRINREIDAGFLELVKATQESARRSRGEVVT